jgi:hypothetical protein
MKEPHSVSRTQLAICPDAHKIARMVPIRHLLSWLSLRMRNSKRADCPLCKGNSNGMIAFTERLWHCHRCNEGGDIFSLVRAVNRCDFREAPRFIAGLAGIRLENSQNAKFRNQLDGRNRQRESLEGGAGKPPWHAACKSVQLLNVAQLDNVPRELQDGKRFVCWRKENRKEKLAKVPFNPHTGTDAIGVRPGTGAQSQLARRSA